MKVSTVKKKHKHANVIKKKCKINMSIIHLDNINFASLNVCTCNLLYYQIYTKVEPIVKKITKTTTAEFEKKE